MSVAAMIRRQRTRAAIYRGTPATGNDGNRYFSGFTVQSVDVPISIQNPTASRVETVFGSDFPVDAVAYAHPDLLAEEDRIEVTEGPFAGERYVVRERIRHRQGSANDHDELALESTDEVLA